MLDWVLVSRPVWEQHYIDFWSVPHFLTGVLFGLAILVADKNKYWGFALCAAVTIAWELLENVAKVSAFESSSNQVTDVALSLCGYLVAMALYQSTRRSLASLLAVFSAVVVGFWFLGWSSFSFYSVIPSV